MLRRNAIALAPHEDQLLRQRYQAHNIPTDQYKQRPNDSARFLSEWNRLSGRSDRWEDLLHYMILRRKKGRWVVLGDGYKRLADPPPESLTSAQWSELVESYRVVVLARGIASDALQIDPDLAGELAREFARRTGRSLPSGVLAGLLIARRKRGELDTLRPPPEVEPTPEVEHGREPWDDIDEADRGAA